MKTDFIYTKINEAVIKGLKAKGLEWFKPWTVNGIVGHNVNYMNGTRYHGVNVFILNNEMIEKGYASPEWITYKNAEKAGGKVRKGEKSTMIVFWKPYWVNDEKKFSPVEKKGYEIRFMLRYYNVFNIGQCDGLESKIPPVEEPKEKVKLEPIERADAIIKGYKTAPKIVSKDKARAYYQPATDIINMPEMDDFVDADSFYKTLFHEAAHSTGHKARLNRKTLIEMKKFGDKSYSREELVAEISSQYLTGVAELEPKDGMANTQAYVNGWIKHLTDHEKEALTAMGQAAKAVDYILGV